MPLGMPWDEYYELINSIDLDIEDDPEYQRRLAAQRAEEEEIKRRGQREKEIWDDYWRRMPRKEKIKYYKDLFGGTRTYRENYKREKRERNIIYRIKKVINNLFGLEIPLGEEISEKPVTISEIEAIVDREEKEIREKLQKRFKMNFDEMDKEISHVID